MSHGDWAPDSDYAPDRWKMAESKNRLDALNKEEFAKLYKTMPVRQICSQYNVTTYMLYKVVDKLGIPRKEKAITHADALTGKIKSN